MVGGAVGLADDDAAAVVVLALVDVQHSGVGVLRVALRDALADVPLEQP
ncbi:hypothetical protein [Streptomyces colonosanans]|nr:hypothetical protein [Streptomyces colonosanans]